jgi:hypothetical protein
MFVVAILKMHLFDFPARACCFSILHVDRVSEKCSCVLRLLQIACQVAQLGRVDLEVETPRGVSGITTWNIPLPTT